MTFHISKFGVGDAKKTTTLKGKKVGRQEKIFVLEFGKFVPCTPYDNHFIYETDEPNQSTYMCTCGSPAVFVPPAGESQTLVCLFHATNGNHTTGEKRWV